MKKLKKTLFFTGVFSLYFYIFYNQMYQIDGSFSSDLPAHMSLGQQFLSGENFLPHPGFYIFAFLLSLISPFDFEQSAILILSLLIVLISWIIYKLLSEYTDKGLAYTGILMLVSPVFIPFFNQIYLGQFSSNIYHNPTLIVVKPIAYLSLVFFIKMIDKPGAMSVILTAFLLVTSAIMKPNFVLIFIFVAPIYLLIRRVSIKKWILLIGVLIPTGCLLMFQYLKTYNSAEDSNIVIDFLGVWNLYSPSPLISTLISILFPLLLILFRGKVVWQNSYLLFSWIGVIVALVQFAVLAEEGLRFADGNFSWGMQIMIPLIFLFSIIELIKWKQEVKVTGRNSWRLSLVQVALALHIFSGGYYLMAILTGNSYI